MMRFKREMTLLLTLIIVAAAVFPTYATGKKTVKLSKTKITMTAGQTKTITLKKGTKKLTSGVKWKSSNKKVVTVSRGKLRAKKAGKATVTATYKKKTYRCKVTVRAKAAPDPACDFNEYVIQSILMFETGGGYYTGRSVKPELEQNAWEGMDRAIALENGTVSVDVSMARPSFCSSATYMALLNALSIWDKDSVISYEAWKNMKPYTVDGGEWPIQADGVGCWGRANANGPGVAVLVSDLGAGINSYLPPRESCASDDEYFGAWRELKQGDFLKIFWNENIGYDEQSDIGERGHMVVFLRMDEFVNEEGVRDGLVYYWSSNGSGYMPDKGYGIATARLSSIYRAVSTRITDPAAFDNAKSISPDDTEKWLSGLDGARLATEDELLDEISGRKVSEEQMDSFGIYGISDEIFSRIEGKSFKADCTVPREDLRYLHALHKDIEGVTHEGEMIVNRHIAEDVLEIFKELYENNYPIEKMVLIDEYDADDEMSMRDNNSSSFNFRFISHTTRVSKHGLGLAVDINTLYNPYTKVVDGVRIIEPATGEPYLDRNASFDYKIDKGDLCYKLFIEHGFEWGGDWTDVSGR